MKVFLEKAKPCPFCGSTSLDVSVKNKQSDWRTKVSGYITIYCNKCHAAGPRFLYYAEPDIKLYRQDINQKLIDEVIEMWNKRIT